MRLNVYPNTIEEWEARSNFKRACKNFSIKNDQFVSQETTCCSYGETTSLELIKKVQEGVGQSTHSKAMASHEGRYSTYLKISERSFWY